MDFDNWHIIDKSIRMTLSNIILNMTMPCSPCLAPHCKWRNNPPGWGRRWSGCGTEGLGKSRSLKVNAVCWLIDCYLIKTSHWYWNSSSSLLTIMWVVIRAAAKVSPTMKGLAGITIFWVVICTHWIMLGVGLAVWVSLDVHRSSLVEPVFSMRTYGAEIASVSVSPLV